MPTGKPSPGPFERRSSTATPDKSVADGSTQKMVADVSPNSITADCALGHPVIVGGTVSTENVKFKN